MKNLVNSFQSHNAMDTYEYEFKQNFKLDDCSIDVHQYFIHIT